MLTILEELPDGFLDTSAVELDRLLKGPTLIHIPGKRQPALFVSVLLHGNETTGFQAVQALLRKYSNTDLPRALTLFVGNITAARRGVRRLPEQSDYNRVWQAGTSPEHVMTHQVLEEMRRRGVFISVDIHNNTGMNPHYACVNRLDHRFFHLAILFNRTVVYFTRPAGVQTSAFADLCPAVTLECGQVGESSGLSHAQEYLEACLHLSEIPAHPVSERDIDLFHTQGIIKIPDLASLGFGSEAAEIRFIENLDHLNFTELSPGTLLGWIRQESEARLIVSDEEGRDVGENYFDYSQGEIRTKVPFMPSMLTLDRNNIRQDCLGYIMERIAAVTDFASEAPK